MNCIKKNVLQRKPVSRLRKQYIARLIGRCAILLVSLLICLIKPEELQILEGMAFFREFSIFHILWLIWLLDMLQQLIPIKKHLPLGSQKLFQMHFRPVYGEVDSAALKKYTADSTRSAYGVLVLWALLIAAIGALYFKGVINKTVLFLISVVFYVCDLICVLIWCPFRVLLKNQCCTTCRIFNWDHLMMFSPLIFIGGFYAITLVVMAVIVWIIWEVSAWLFPERFWEKTNEALKCSKCTDKLCTQRCFR